MKITGKGEKVKSENNMTKLVIDRKRRPNANQRKRIAWNPLFHS